MATTQSAEATRTARAEEEHMTLYALYGDEFVIEGDSGNRHVLNTSGSTALECSCGDHQNRSVRCKHMAAYEEWLIDEVIQP